MKTGEYLRSAEITEEQNYNMIDGRINNLPNKPRKIGGRVSVLDRLHLKQAEICQTEREDCAADGGGRRDGAEKEIKKEEDVFAGSGRHLPLFLWCQTVTGNIFSSFVEIPCVLIIHLL